MLFSASGYRYNSSSSSSNSTSNNHIANNNSTVINSQTFLLNDVLPEEIDQQHLKRAEEKARNIAIAFAVGGILLLITFTYSLLDKCIDEDIPTFLVIIYVIPYNCIGLILAIGIILICNTSKSTRHVIHCVRWTGVVMVFTIFILTHMIVILLYWRGHHTGNGFSSFTLFASYIIGLIPILRVKSFMDKWVIYKRNIRRSGMRSTPSTTTTMTCPDELNSNGCASSSRPVVPPCTTQSTGPTLEGRMTASVHSQSHVIPQRNSITTPVPTVVPSDSSVFDPPPPSYNEAMRNIIVDSKKKDKKKSRSTKNSPITKL